MVETKVKYNFHPYGDGKIKKINQLAINPNEVYIVEFSNGYKSKFFGYELKEQNGKD